MKWTIEHVHSVTDAKGRAKALVRLLCDGENVGSLCLFPWQVGSLEAQLTMDIEWRGRAEACYGTIHRLEQEAAVRTLERDEAIRALDRSEAQNSELRRSLATEQRVRAATVRQLDMVLSQCQCGSSAPVTADPPPISDAELSKGGDPWQVGLTRVVLAWCVRQIVQLRNSR